LAQERLRMNDIDGEELPFIHDCAVAVALLTNGEGERDAAARGAMEASKAFAAEQDAKEAQAYRDAAKRLHHREGECEIDDNATVSFGDDAGAYVQAWVWIPAADAGLDVEE
jgi:hypothetical protein